MPPDETTCKTDIELNAISPQGATYFWATDPDIINIVGENPSIMVTPIGETTYYLLLRDETGCLAMDSVKIIGQGINSDVEKLDIICDGDEVELLVSCLLYTSPSPRD